jgi:ketosteroid isomerase-like protein
MDQDLQARLDAVESREQIRELPAKYVWASARADVPAMMVLFTEDCAFEMGPAGARAKLKGRDAVNAVLSKAVTKPGGIIALIQNQTIEVNGDTATGTCVMHNPMAPAAAGPFIGYYKDEFRRENGKWLFSARRFWNYSPTLDLSGG